MIRSNPGAALLAAGPALASQCPKLIAQINGAAGNRFDATANDAKAKAQKLHNEKKHPEAEKVAKEALTKLGIMK